jgi:hypothetical protein
MHATTHQTLPAQGDLSAVRHPSANSTLIERVAPQPAERAPISMAPIERVRSTSATQRRIENMQKLIGELATHEMLADEIAWFLKFSPSGARKYIRDLRDAGVIELASCSPSARAPLPARNGRACASKAWPAPVATSTSWPTTRTTRSV